MRVELCADNTTPPPTPTETQSQAETETETESPPNSPCGYTCHEVYPLWCENETPCHFLGRIELPFDHGLHGSSSVEED